jgi:hypothetical protein
MFDFIYTVLKEVIIVPLITIINFIRSIIKDFFTQQVPWKKYILIINAIAVLVLIIVGYFVVSRGDKSKEPAVQPPPPAEIISFSEIEGFYIASIADGIESNPLTLDIKKVPSPYPDQNIACTLADKYDIGKPVLGTLSLRDLLIYIPGYGFGKIKKNQFDEIFLDFFIKGREIQFIKASITINY